MRIEGRFWIGILTVVLLLAVMGSAHAQQTSSQDLTRRFELGANLGFSGGTIDGTALAIAINGDYLATPHIAVGPLIQFGLTEDLFQIGVSLQAKFFLDLPDTPQLKPHLQIGVGFIHADFGNTFDDTSWLIPIGMGVEFRVDKNLYLDSTLLLNLTDLNIPGASDDLHVTWFVGLRFLL